MHPDYNSVIYHFCSMMTHLGIFLLQCQMLLAIHQLGRPSVSNEPLIYAIQYLNTSSLVLCSTAKQNQECHLAFTYRIIRPRHCAHIKYVLWLYKSRYMQCQLQHVYMTYAEVALKVSIKLCVMTNEGSPLFRINDRPGGILHRHCATCYIYCTGFFFVFSSYSNLYLLIYNAYLAQGILVAVDCPSS